MPGPRVIAEIDLLPAPEGGLHSPIKEGDRSLILIFDGGSEGDVQLGGVFEHVPDTARPGSTVTVRIWF